MRIAVETVLLACCATEAATALAAPPSTPDIDWVDGDAPRDVTVIVLAGTITHANSDLVQRTIDHAPQPRTVVAFGVCASSGGPYWDSHAVLRGWQSADMFVPGCPPPPVVFWSAVTRAAEAVMADAAR